MLIDSNGKEIITGKLYPGYNNKKTPCMTTEKVLTSLILVPSKRSQKEILICFGTNDLKHEDRNEVASKLVEVITVLSGRIS